MYILNLSIYFCPIIFILVHLFYFFYPFISIYLCSFISMYDLEKITSYPLDICVPWCRWGRGFVEKAGWMGLEQVTLAWQISRSNLSLHEVRWGKNSLVTERISRPPNSTNRTQKTIWALLNQTSTVLIKQS